MTSTIPTAGTGGVGCRSLNFDIYEVNDTLLLRTDRASHKMWVTARFNVYGTLSEVMYVFVWDDLGWRINDIAGPNGAVSDMTCPPKHPSPDWLRGSGFCSVTDTAELVMDEAGWSGARITFESWQTDDGYCAGAVWADPTDYGWQAWSGATRRLEMESFDDGGLYVLDPGQSCAPHMCQNGGTLDGLAVPAWAEVNCFEWGD